MREIDARYCPNCGEKLGRINTSRGNPGDGHLIRYRECDKCLKSYRTFEIHDWEYRQLQKYRELALETAHSVSKIARGDADV